MRSLLLKGTTAALFAAALAPIAYAQNSLDIPLVAKKVGVQTQILSFIYDNTNDFAGSAFANGGATVIAGNTLTQMVMDDVTFPAGFGGRNVLQFFFNVANLNLEAVTARPRIRFWLPDGPDGGPGTYYINNGTGNFGFTFNPITFDPDIVSGFFTEFAPQNPASFEFFVPDGGAFWVGMTFDNNGAVAPTGATAAQLNNLGTGLFNAPTLGTSADRMFLTTNAGSFFGVSNPPGAFIDFGGAPTANMGFGFVIDANIVSGVITLEGAVNKAQPVTFTFKVGGVVQFTRTVTLGADGSYSLDLIPADTYTVSIKGAKWLRKNITVDATAADVTNANATLRAGDGTNDNVVDIADLTLLIGVYNQVEGAPGSTYLQAADYNTDGTNDITDLFLLIGNYNQLGDSL